MCNERLKSHGIFFGWIVTIMSLCVTSTAFGVLYSFGVFFNAWLQEWSTSRAILSGVFSISFLAYGIASIVMGWLTDKFGPRKTLIVGGIIMGAGCFLTAQSHHVALVYLTWGIMIGIGVGTSYAPTASTVSRWFVYRKGLAVGIVVSGLGLGTLIFSPLSEFLVEYYGWRNAARVLGVIIWSVFICVGFFIRRSPEDVGLKALTATTEDNQKGIPVRTREMTHLGREVSRSMSLAEALRTKEIWFLFMIHGLWMAGVGVSMAHLIPYATDMGVAASTAAAMLGILGAMSVVGRLSLGLITEHWGTRRSLITMITFQTCMMLWLIFSTSPWMFWSFALLFGFSYGGVASIWPLATAEIFGLKSMGSIFGIILLGAAIGVSAGAPLAGMVFDKSGGYGIAFLGAALSMGIGVALASQVRTQSEV